MLVQHLNFLSEPRNSLRASSLSKVEGLPMLLENYYELLTAKVHHLCFDLVEKHQKEKPEEWVKSQSGCEDLLNSFIEAAKAAYPDQLKKLVAENGSGLNLTSEFCSMKDQQFFSAIEEVEKHFRELINFCSEYDEPGVSLQTILIGMHEENLIKSIDGVRGLLLRREKFDHLPLLNIKTQQLEPALTRSVYENISTEQLEEIINIANQSVGKKGRGISQPVDRSELEELIQNNQLLLATIEHDGKIKAFELVFIGQHCFSDSKFDPYFEKYYFHGRRVRKNKIARIKLSGVDSEFMREFADYGLKRSPFSILRTSMTAKLRSKKVDFALGEVRVEPEVNAASMQAITGDYFLRSEFFTEALIEGVKHKFQIVLRPVVYGQFFNSAMNYA